MTPDKEQEILDAYISGLKVVEITKDFKVSSATVSKILKKHNITSRYKSTENINKSIYQALLTQNNTPEELSIKYNIDIKEILSIYRKERDKHLIKDYKANVKFDDICMKYHLSNMAVYKILNKNHIDRRLSQKSVRTHRMISNHEKELILSDYQNKKNINDILTTYSITKSQLYSILYHAGISLRNKSNVSAELKEQIIKDYNNGKTKTELSYKYRISRTLISLIISGG